jgi:hypothetical protein
MRKHNSNPKNLVCKSSYKDRLIELKPERYLSDLLLIGVWQDYKELAAFVVPISVWKDKNQLLEIVNEIIFNTIQKTGTWK